MASSGLLYLTPREFMIKQTEKGYSLCHRLKGVSMVLFYSKTCKYCENLIPGFKTLPGKVQGVYFAMANVSADNKRLEQMAGATLTPIQYVPYIVFYVNGEYFMEYRGPKTVDSMARAAYEIANKAHHGQNFTTGKVCTSTSTGLAGYCVGEDNWEDDVCMTYGEVYNNAPAPAEKHKSCMTYEECYGRPQAALPSQPRGVPTHPMYTPNPGQPQPRPFA